MVFPISFGRRASLSSMARVLKGRMLEDEFFWSLLFKCHSMSEIALQLQKSSSYGPYLQKTDPSKVHRFQLESILSLVPFREAGKFRFLAGTTRWKVIEEWKGLYETDLLKKIIRHVYSGKEQGSQVLEERIDMIGDISYPGRELLQCRNIDEILPVLEETPYYEVLKGPLEKKDSGTNTLFPVEMAIDNYKLCEIFRSTERLKGREKKVLADLYGTRADLLNLYWLYRSRRFFSMSPEEMISRILPFRRHLGRKELRKLVFAPDLSTFHSLLSNTWYGKFIEYPENMDQGTVELVLERSINRIIYDKARRIFLGGVPGVHTAIAYLLLREYEVRDIITIIEDVRYDFSRRMAVLFLVRKMKAEEAS